MIRSDDLDQLATALSAAQAEFSAIPKDSKNPFFRSTYAGLPVVIDRASPILTGHGLSVSQLMGHACDGNHDLLTTILLHQSGQFIGDTCRLHLVDSKGVAKDDPQAHGSATTYARRYGYMSILGLVADEDDDGNSTTQPKQATARPKAHKDTERPAAPRIPGDRALSILSAAMRANMAQRTDVGVEFSPVFRAQLATVGASKIAELNVDQAEVVEGFLRNEEKDVTGV